MRTSRAGSRGFTLVEVIVVLAVLAALVSIVAPRLVVYVDDANHVRAQADANRMAAAIETMYKDTGRWPFYEDGASSLEFTAGADFAVLTTNPLCDGSDDAITCDDTLPEDATTGDTWDLATATTLTDTLAHHLIMNRPLYKTTGHRRWRGPYLEGVPVADPWGRSFLVNIANADPMDEGVTHRWVIVISAGPNGNLETDADLEGTDNPQAGGDDIIARVK